MLLLQAYTPCKTSTHAYMYPEPDAYRGLEDQLLGKLLSHVPIRIADPSSLSPGVYPTIAISYAEPNGGPKAHPMHSRSRELLLQTETKLGHINAGLGPATEYAAKYVEETAPCPRIHAIIRSVKTEVKWCR
jgi:hypothetical protein